MKMWLKRVLGDNSIIDDNTRVMDTVGGYWWRMQEVMDTGGYYCLLYGTQVVRVNDKGEKKN